ncbi:MAG TPA: CsgG/HfaB family protein [Hyphomicrobiaceae bacterium]|nr:CsgG/HfaB family protein [Hyphomicrobiaceae bacterium]
MLCVLAAGVLGACSKMLESAAEPSTGLLPPAHNPVTKINAQIRALPPPERRVPVAVYGFSDQTGQFKQPENVQSLSRAVTQGATSVLIKALQDAGEGSWFLVVEREKLDNLLKERRIIADMRQRYLGEKNLNPQALPPLLFAGVLLEGGIIGFDSNTKTGGAGARYLGIGGDVQYREDTVTVYLRAVSTKTGEVMSSVVSHKTIVSYGIKGDAFKFVAVDKILEVEAGFTRNEPEQLAVQQAIEKAVHTLIIDGAARGMWSFADKLYQAAAVAKLDNELSITRTAKVSQSKTETAVASANAAPANEPASPPQDAKALAGQSQPGGQNKLVNTVKPAGNAAQTAPDDRRWDGKPDAWRAAVSQAQITERNMTESERLGGGAGVSQ